MAMGPGLMMGKPRYHDKSEEDCRKIIAESTDELERINRARRIYDLRVAEGAPEPARDLGEFVANFDGEVEKHATMITWAQSRIAAIAAEAEAVRLRAERKELLRRLEREHGIRSA